MHQSTLDFKKEQEIPDRDHQFRRKGLANRSSKVLDNQLKDDSNEILSESTPEKQETMKGGRAQAKREAKNSKKK